MNQTQILYTYESVASAAGVTVSAVKMYFTRHEWNFGDISLVARYIVRCRLDSNIMDQEKEVKEILKYHGPPQL